jgi:hypothetical protein
MRYRSDSEEALTNGGEWMFIAAGYPSMSPHLIRLRGFDRPE